MIKLSLPRVRWIPKRGSPGWVLTWILIGLYFLLKLQGWWYAAQVRQLERQLDRLRPTIARIIQYDHLEVTRQACLTAFDQVRRMDLGGGKILEQISRNLPASLTLTRMEVDPQWGIKASGSLVTGDRSPEETLFVWLYRLQKSDFSVRVKELMPDPQLAGFWRFEVEARPNA